MLSPALPRRQDDARSAVTVADDLFPPPAKPFPSETRTIGPDGKAKDEMAALLRRKFADDARLLAAWQALEHGPGIRGGVGWERVKRLMADEDLDLDDAKLESDATEALIKRMTGNPVLYVETISYQHFDEGPALDVHQVSVNGPLKRVEDADARRRPGDHPGHPRDENGPRPVGGPRVGSVVRGLSSEDRPARVRA